MFERLVSLLRKNARLGAERGDVMESDVRRVLIYVKDGIDLRFVKNALHFVPGTWRFEFAEQEPRYYNFGGEWRGFLVPTEENALVIFDGTKRGARYGGGTIGTSVGVARFEYDTDVFKFGLRIWHELLHTVKANADGMARNPDFDAWLEPQIREKFVSDKPGFQHSAQYQALYYHYLTLGLLPPVSKYPAHR